jgi:hypothetical protein
LAHLTEIKESMTEVYDMAANAQGFWTKPMADCALVVVLWEKHGSLYAHGRGQHCSGGILAVQTDALVAGVPQGDAMIVLVWGSTPHPGSFSDAEGKKALETLARNNNWAIQIYQADASDSVVTNAGAYQTKQSFDAQQQPVAENLNKGRCCVIM